MRSSSTRNPLTGGRSGTERHAVPRRAAQHDRLTIFEAAQAERIVGADDELHATERVTQAFDDAHTPTRVQVGAEFINRDEPLGSFECAFRRRLETGDDVASQARTDW